MIVPKCDMCGDVISDYGEERKFKLPIIIHDMEVIYNKEKIIPITAKNHDLCYNCALKVAEKLESEMIKGE